MKNQNLEYSRVATLAIALLTLITSGATAKAGQVRVESEGRQYVCSDQTVAGDYGWTAEGVLTGTPGLPANAPFRSVGTIHLDGKGNLTWLERTVINGQAVGSDFTEAGGTYRINANCTGSAVVNTLYSPVPLDLALVVVNNGKEFRSVLTTNAIVTVFKRLD